MICLLFHSRPALSVEEVVSIINVEHSESVDGAVIITVGTTAELGETTVTLDVVEFM